MGSPRGMSRTTLVTMSVVMVISLAYAACVNQPRVRILIYVPVMMDLGKNQSLFPAKPGDLNFICPDSRNNLKFYPKCEKTWAK